jgi:poly-gamma-glutamate capsule biosynthesis protein CapA/YwtB (metallophosphatase superfamily)
MLLAWIFVHFQTKTWDLYCGGDIMLNGVAPNRQAFKGISVPPEAIFYANLEIPLTNVAEQTPHKSAADVAAKKQFILKADPLHIKDVVSARIDVVSLGNNHAMDSGSPGLNQMLSLLDKNGIKHAGAGVNWQRAVEPAIVISSNGTRVAFLSYLSFLSIEGLRHCTPATGMTPGIAVLTLQGKDGPDELSRLKKIVDRARAKADVVIVALHWGVERQPLPAGYQVSLGRLFVDAGADAIIGAHPHVLQPGELYRGKPIIYSLGNLVNPGQGESALYKLTFEKSRFKKAEIMPTTYSNGQVKLSRRKPAEISSKEFQLKSQFPSYSSSTLTAQMDER